jgi:hypothetical protein
MEPSDPAPSQLRCAAPGLDPPGIGDLGAAVPAAVELPLPLLSGSLLHPPSPPSPFSMVQSTNSRPRGGPTQGVAHAPYHAVFGTLPLRTGDPAWFGVPGAGGGGDTIRVRDQATMSRSVGFTSPIATSLMATAYAVRYDPIAIDLTVERKFIETIKNTTSTF